MPATAAIGAVLFDLDGTLVDSAPDMAAAANRLRQRYGMAALPLEALRPMVGSGARGMLEVAFECRPGDSRYEGLRVDFLSLYAEGLLAQTRVFAAVEPVLDRLERVGVPWGVVTNKAMALALPIVDGLGLGGRARALVAGDSTPFTKPHPEPLLEAARRIGMPPSRCVYVGDDPRDVRAGRAAGMATLAAAWGYLGLAEPIDAWGADHVLGTPAALLNWMELP